MIAMANEGYDTCPLEGLGQPSAKKDIETTSWC